MAGHPEKSSIDGNGHLVCSFGLRQPHRPPPTRCLVRFGTGTESDETPGWWWPVGLSQSEGAHEMAVSVDGALFRVPGHLGVGRPSIYTTASGEIYQGDLPHVSNGLGVYKPSGFPPGTELL